MPVANLKYRSARQRGGGVKLVVRLSVVSSFSNSNGSLLACYVAYRSLGL